MQKVLHGLGMMLLIFLAVKCEKIRSFPAVPHIHYLSYTLANEVDTLQNKVKALTVEFSFEDGDGDLFSDSIRSDSTSKIYYIFYHRLQGQKVRVADNDLPSSFNFPWDESMQRNGQNKLQKGTVRFHYLFNYPLPFDTLNVEFFITDGKLHKSNLESVPGDIILK